jgi:hypothetical protein
VKLLCRDLVDGDITMLDRITSADYVHVESTGQLRTKEQFLEGLARHEYKFWAIYR